MKGEREVRERLGNVDSKCQEKVRESAQITQKLPQTVQWIRPYTSQRGVGRLLQEKGKERKQEQDTLER